MLSLASPGWLLALSVLPLVWWLHRFHDLDRAQPVAALFLWPVREAQGSQSLRARRADPIWLWRALTAGLVVLALAEPHWRGRNAGALHLWIDDSPSMFALERGESRMALALAALEQPLAAGRFSSVTAHSLAAPGVALSLDPRAAGDQLAALRAWAGSPRGEPAPPPAALLDTADSHWLISDGASPGLEPWLRLAPVTGLFSAGTATENAGITALSLRRDSATGGARLLVTVANGGRETALRELRITVGERSLAPLPLRIPPGQAAQEIIDFPAAPTATLRAGISPADALPLDDALELPAARLRPATFTTSPDCGRHLRAALAAHPALVPAADASGSADLAVHCGGDGAGQVGPALRSAAGQDVGPVRGPLLWLPEAGALRELSLQPDWLAAAPARPLTGAGLVLLRDARRPLILFDPNRRIIDTRLDLGAPELVTRPEYPLLVAGLVDLLLQPGAAPGGAVSAPGPGAVSIAPRPLAAGPRRPGAGSSPSSRDLGGAFIIAAALTLVLDLALRRRRLAQRPQRPAIPAGLS